MAKETTFQHPPRGLVAALGYESAGDQWRAVAMDADGNPQVDVAASALPAGAATEATLAAIEAAMVERAATPTIYNLTLTLADTEYSQALPASTRKFTMQCRGAYDVLIAFTSGQSGTTYITIKSGTAYWEDQITATSLTVYAQCAEAGQVLEIVAWS